MRYSSINRLVLASASASRAAMLRNSGVRVTVDPADIDEASVKQRGREDGCSVRDVAFALATQKAKVVARRHPDSLVIGCDQMLECEGQWLDKNTTLEAARDQLSFLRGRTHRLLSAAVVVTGDDVAWSFVDEARLMMRSFSDAFLDLYLSEAGEEALGTVGGYRLEGRGSQFFDAIDGDFFSILGLPLLPVLAYLRYAGALED